MMWKSSSSNGWE